MRTLPADAVFGRSTLAGRLVGPVVGLVVVAVATNLGFTAWLATRRAAASAGQRQRDVEAVLRYSGTVPSLPVLRALQQRTGDEFIVWDAAGGVAGPSTLPASAIDVTAIVRGLVRGEATLDGRRYRLGEIRLPHQRPSSLLVLAPIKPFADMIVILWPFLAMAAATLLVLVPLGGWTARRLTAKLAEIERHVGRIALGEFGCELPTEDFASQPEEISRLVAGINRMRATLRDLESTLVAGERQRLLGQLAAGFAHELRNAVTGANLAIDLHRRRCPMGEGSSDDESLAVAKSQLEILEEEVRGLLALGKPVESAPRRLPIGPLVEDVCRLLGPRCDHAGVRIECICPDDLVIHGRRESLRAAIVNLALNGIDAAGNGGWIRLDARQAGGGVAISVADSGGGPPEAIRSSMHEPFVSGKPEGIGLGLAVAHAVAGLHGGRLDWRRPDGQTVFEMWLPNTTLEAPAPPEDDRS